MGGNQQPGTSMENSQQESTIDPNKFPLTTLFIPNVDLDVICESIINFDNLYLNGLVLFEDITKQKWESFFSTLKGPVYLALVKYFWLHASATNYVISSFVLSKSITFTEKSLTKLLSFDGTGNIFSGMSIKSSKRH